MPSFSLSMNLGALIVNDTIAGISTAAGEGAIAVIRVSGPEAAAMSRQVFPTRGTALTGTPRVMRYGRIVRKTESLDTGMAAYFPAPRSYTGEDMVEIYCHGGILVAARVLEAVLELGARAAEAGEFTRRAFLNGKLDLTQAEAVMDIIRARSPIALAAAEEQLQGRLGRELAGLRAHLLSLVANIEAWIDFPDEDIDPATGAGFLAEIRKALQEVETLLSTARTGRILREGVRLVIFGSPNAGKSSLLNALLGFERAIVTPTPGTTRDTIEELANLGGLPFCITDTAGLRETEDPIEKIGMARAHEAMAAADILLHVVDASAGTEFPDLANAGPFESLTVFNKIDLLDAPVPWPDGAIGISCLTGAGLETLVEKVVARAQGNPQRPSALAINARHQACLQRAKAGLESAAAELESNHSPEFVATGLHEALDAIGDILGLADTEEILGEIFSKFCIGK
ncbi:MAG: tRNA uridine-5-carboxymethylaminomethyl(34) synthesis GTPase MnmE [Terrimicrobiaceae bacterium]